MRDKIYHHTRSILLRVIKIISDFETKWLNGVDRGTFFVSIALMSLGLITLLSVAPAISSRIGVSTYHFFGKQVIFVALSLCIMVYISQISIERVVFYSNIFAVSLIFALFLVLIVGLNIKGSQRWIDLGLLSVQPSELLKPFFVIINAKILSKITTETWKFQVIKSLLFTGIIILLLLLEPDFGMSIIYILTCGIQIFISGVPLRFLRNLAIIFILLCVCAFLLMPHVRNRIKGFANSGDVELNYQVKKGIQSIKEGGFFGKGPGNGSVKYQLPDSHTDFIFAVICEEFGYIIANIIIILYFYIIFKNLIVITKICDNKRNVLIMYGCMFVIFSQVFVNIGVNINILPNKGMVLPFVSYGGSGIMGVGILMGIVLCLTKDIHKIRSNYSKLFSPFRI